RVDKEAIDAAQAYFRNVADDKTKQNLLASLAQQGQPPPAPRGPNPDGSFTTNLGKFTYRWVELGRSERHTLHLSNPRDDKGELLDDATIKKLLNNERVERNGKPLMLDPYWRLAAEARAKGQTFELPSNLLNGCLLWSREATNLREIEKDKEKKWEYFVLER